MRDGPTEKKSRCEYARTADLIIAIQRSISTSGLSQTEAAKKLGVTQPRLSDLYRHRIRRFSLDALVTLAARAGLAVRMTVKKAA